MPKEFFFPDEKEPHIHVTKGGITFTNIKHNHRTLVDGDKVRDNVVREVIDDLKAAGDKRSERIVDWINENIDYKHK
jgi:hypothetical protein